MKKTAFQPQQNGFALRCDFRGFALQAEESCPSAPRGPLRGFFCNQYELAQPPRLSF